MGKGVTPFSGGYFAKSALFRTLVTWRSARFSDLLRRSGRVGDSNHLAGESIAGLIWGGLTTIPLSAIAAFELTPLFFLGCLAPLVLYYLPELRLRDAVAQRREGVERELPFFSVLVGVLGGAGVSLYSILRDVASSDVFPSMRNEALLVKRDVSIFGMNPNESLERLASNHPSKRFRDFLLGYTSKARSGGDVPAYLSSESGSLLRELEDSWVRYVARVGIVGSMMITVFGVVPLLLMVVGVFSPGFSTIGLLLFTLVCVPLLTLVLLYMAGRMQPAREEHLHGEALRSLLLSAVGIPVWVMTGEVWAGLAAGLVVFFISYGTSVRAQIAGSKAVEEGLSRFLGDLLEFQRQDYDLTRAVISIGSNTTYNKEFTKILTKVTTKLKAGVPLDEVRPDCRSGLGKLVFLLLGEMSRSGGGNVETVYQVSNFADRMIQIRRNATAEMKPYLILAYVSPLLLAFGVTFIGGVLSSFGGARGGLFSPSQLPTRGSAALPGLSQVSDLLIVVSAASLGLIAAKITDLTVRNTFRASVNVALAVTAVTVMTTVGSHSIFGLFVH